MSEFEIEDMELHEDDEIMQAHNNYMVRVTLLSD